ncbi:3-hydroxyisobutyryl-CoA hydrolase, mitochondrial [Coccomyxa sp. Obi]|nr:3-hydroxyisobutyryl-CoA hydrolase, mitochondrial [Coccomyxa sp. Obi]
MDADMVEAHHASLKTFASQHDIAAILVEGVPRAFCAGGDIKSIREYALQQPYREDPPIDHPVARVFQTEYNQVCDVARCPVPYISICTGIWMGFGVGNSAHGDVRVVTEDTLFAMPENSIGLFPDVGFAHIAATMPGAVGLYLGLTGKRLSAPEDLLYSGLGTHHVRVEQLPTLRDALVLAPLARHPDKAETLSQLDANLQQFQEPGLAKPQLAKLQPMIDSCFMPALHYRDRGRTAPEALDDIALDLLTIAQTNERPEAKQFAVETLESLQKLCPMSMAITLRHFAAVYHAVRTGAGPLAQIEGVMEQEYALAVRQCGRGDFAEGVRAVVVDKDKNPKWDPENLSDIREDDLDAMFAPMPPGKGLRLDFLDRS